MGEIFLIKYHHRGWILDQARRQIWGEIMLLLREKASGFLRTLLKAGFLLYNLVNTC